MKDNRPELYKDYYCGMSVEAIKLSIINALKYWMGKDEYSATDYDWFMACAYSIRNRIVERWTHTQNEYYRTDSKRVYYLSLEYLIGRLMGNNLFNLEVYDKYEQALKELGFKIEKIRDLENDAGLGNGGLGRLAACFLDSMTTLNLPSYGYGIRYEFGIFRQAIKDGFQVEEPDEWLKKGNPWEMVRPEFTQEAYFGGTVEESTDEKGRKYYNWKYDEVVLGVPYDTPIVGFGTDNVNTLRLWSAKASEQFDFHLFNHGDYVKAVQEKNFSENISKVLYPNDNLIQGKELRLKQEYFFVTCTIKDIIRRYTKMHKDFSQFKDKVAIQLNDTHPTLAIPELMRIFIDGYKLDWDYAWDIIVSVFGYTNHTLLPEALEKWDAELMGRLLPRHLMILYEINYRFLKTVSIKFPGDIERLSRMSIFKEGDEKEIRMAWLCMVGSHSTNGVSELHSRLIKEVLAKDFYETFPERFNNKTNGVTPRRWLLKSNRHLADLFSEHLDNRWITDLYELKKLDKYADNKKFRDRFMAIKQENKEKLAEYIWNNNHVKINTESIFDVQAKRLHEYKRQLLNALHIIHLYLKIKKNKDFEIVPRTFIFAAKAAPGYAIAKLIIKFINSIAEVINNDPDIKDLIKVVFLADYRVSLAEKIIPAADVSEQISTAGMEASGTGNMKFALNGALTIGTLDGANVEMMEEVGEENIYIFGKKTEEIKQLQRNGDYDPMKLYLEDEDLKEVIDLIKTGFFALGNKPLFMPLVERLLNREDRFFLLADFSDYVATQKKIAEDYKDKDLWFKKAVLNSVRMGKFSSDRAISQYASDIWKAIPCKVEFEADDQEEKCISKDSK